MEFTGKRRWRASKDDSWATVVRGRTCGTVVGTRLIDGTRVAVIKADGGGFYAATMPSVAGEIAAPPAPAASAATASEGKSKK